jgi:hypothetical protein
VAEEDPEREAERYSESTFLAKELLAMMHTLRPGGGWRCIIWRLNCLRPPRTTTTTTKRQEP